jgi:hypothetical protein
MEYSFDIDLATKLGADEAIMLRNLIYWIFKNKVNDTNYYDGKYWTYNSSKAFSKLFPFWSERQIRRILLSLMNKNVIITGNYNSNLYNRTLWYALTDEYEYLLFCKDDKYALPSENFHLTEWKNGNLKKVKSFNTNNKPNSKPNICINNGENFSKFSNIINDWFEYKQSRNETYKSEKSKQLLLKKLIELSGDSVEAAEQIVEQSIANNWSGLFELKNKNNTKRTVGIEPEKAADYSLGWQGEKLH